MEVASTSGRIAKSYKTGQRGGRLLPTRVIRLRVEAVIEVGKVNHQPVPEPKGYQPAVVPGSRTKPTPLLSPDMMVRRLQSTLHNYGQAHFGAFYSSHVGGIITDPALVLVPIDDQFVCKGYGVSECVTLRDGHLYMLDEHILRLEESCDRIGLRLPLSSPAVKRILLDTAAASGKLNGQVRLWVTPGRGGFSPVQVGGAEPALYVLCIADTYEIDRTEAWEAVVVNQPIRATAVSNVLGNQHLLTSVAQLDARAHGSQVAIFTDEEGFVQHCAGFNLCILTSQDKLVYPPFESAPPSVTLTRMLELLPGEREQSPDDVIVKEVQQRKMHVSEITSAKEAFFVCTTYIIVPIRSVDGKPVKDKMSGQTTLALHYMLDNDLQPPPAGVFSARHTPVPYGYMTGMRSQLK